MTHRPSHRTIVAFCTAAVAAVFAVSQQSAKAAAPSTPEEVERCATRLSIAFKGESATASDLTNPNPQSMVDQLLADNKFRTRFASFINSKMNGNPGANATEDAAYYMAKYVLDNNLEWHEMFDGKYKVVSTDAANPNKAETNGANVQVVADPTGLGFFRSARWGERYKGNELAGLQLVKAFRMQQNVIGLDLVASTNAPGADLSANGRQAPACAGCHYNSWYALDKVAKVLLKKRKNNQGVDVLQNGLQVYDNPANGDQDIFGTKVNGDDGQGDAKVVATLVNSDLFNFRACRLAFNFLYGRDEVRCEGPLFDKCVDEFKATKRITAAIAVVAKDATFCQ